MHVNDIPHLSYYFFYFHPPRFASFLHQNHYQTSHIQIISVIYMCTQYSALAKHDYILAKLLGTPLITTSGFIQ